MPGTSYVILTEDITIIMNNSVKCLRLLIVIYYHEKCIIIMPKLLLEGVGRLGKVRTELYESSIHSGAFLMTISL